ncbi:MAG: DotI/IcmL/TraM family protein [Alphaproteobacteria bacterium]
MADDKDKSKEFVLKGALVLLALMFAPAIIEAYRGLSDSSNNFEVTYTDQCENRYFATTEDGRLFQMQPLDRPGITQAALISWVSEAVIDTMTFGFHDYRMRMQDNSRYFTRKGWESFTTALQNARIIEMVAANQQVVSAAVNAAPVVVSEGVVEQNYQWTVQVPFVVTYQSGARLRSDNLLVTLVIVRSSRLENDKGIAIQQWIAAPR